MKNLSKQQIESLVKQAETGDNQWGQLSDRASNLKLNLRLIQGKILIDRWCNVTTTIVFNTQHKDYVHSILKNEDYYTVDTIWGADISYSDFVPEDKILMFSFSIERYGLNKYIQDMNNLTSNNDDPCLVNGRSVAIIPMVQYDRTNI